MATSEPLIPGADHAALVPIASHAGAPAIIIKRPVTAIGSRKDAVRIHLDSSTVSKVHCVVVLNDWGCYVHDMGSRTHTWVNGKQVVDSNLTDGDVLQVGRFQFKYVAPMDVTPVPEKASEDSLDVSTLSDPLPLHKRVIQIGRRVGSDLQLDDNKISNVHAILFECNGIRFARDMASRTGTWIDGKPVHQEPLYEGAALRIGGITLTYRKTDTSLGLEELPDSTTEPLTLHESAPAPSLGLDAIEPLELDEVPLTSDLDLADADLPILDDEVEASADDADALADLRRNWQAPTRHIEPEPVVPAPVADIPSEAIAHEIVEETPELIAKEPEVVPLPVADTVSVTPELPLVEPIQLDELPESPTPIVADPVVEPEAIVAESPAEIADEPEIDLTDLAPLDLEPLDEESANDKPLDLDLHSIIEAPADTESATVETLAEGVADTHTLPMAPVEEELAEPTVAPSEPEKVATDADLAAELHLDSEELSPLDLEPLDLDLGDLELEPIADATEGASDEPVAAAVSEVVNIVTPVEESDKPALTEGVSHVSDTVGTDVEATEPTAAVAPVVEEIPAAPSETVPSPEAALADLELEPDLDLPELDLSDIAAALPAGTLVEDAETAEPLVADTLSEALGSPAAEPPVAVSEIELPEIGLPAAAKLPPDADDEEIIELEPDVAEAVTPEAVAAPVTPPTPQPKLMPEPEPVAFDQDQIDLALDLDQPFEEPDDATALAVDFGLDELDHGDDLDDEDEIDAGLTAERPVEIDFSAPKLGISGSEQDLEPPEIELESADLELGEMEPIDLSSLDAVSSDDDPDTDSPERPLINLADTVNGESSIVDPDDVFEAESFEVGSIEAFDDEPPAAGAKSADDHIPPPQGGSLNDLIPNGPPLLGGAFTGDLHGPVVGGSPGIDFRTPQPKPDTKRRGPLRVGNDSRRGGASPFASNTPSISDVLVGRRGGQSVDVFANPSPSADELKLSESIPDSTKGVPVADDMAIPAAAAEDLADITLTTEQREILQTAEAFKPRGPAAFNTPIVIPPTSAAEAAAQHAAAHKKRLGRVFGSLLLLFMLLGSLGFGIYKYVPVYSTLEGVITFNGLDRLGADDARQFHQTQSDNIKSESVRQSAVQSLPAGVTFGFLSSLQQLTSAINTDPKTLWPSDQPTMMRLEYRSTDKADDLIRLRAFSQAVIDANTADINRVTQLKSQIEKDSDNNQNLQRKIADLNDQLQILQQAAERRPDPAKIAELTTDKEQAEVQLRAIRSSRQELEASEDRLSKQSTASNDQPVIDVNAAAADQELTKLNAQMADLQKQGQMLAAGASEKTDNARKTLDSTIADVQESLQTAQKLRDDPGLAAYIDAANALFTQTRQLTEDQIRRQENTRTQLTELKAALSDRMAAWTADLQSKDEELKKLNDRLAIGTRQYNAAVAQGYTDEAKKTDLENDLVKSLIAGRTELYTKGPVYDTIGEMQQIIQRQQKFIDEDRQHINDVLAKAQDDFMKHSPAVAQLPAEQKALAAAIEKKLNDVADARKQYDTASVRTQAEQTKIDADLKDKTSAVQLEIAARKHDLELAAQQQSARDAAAARQKQLDDTRTALADTRGKEDLAQKKLDGAVAALELAEKQRRDFSESDADREAKLAGKQEYERALQAVQSRLATAQSERARLIVPEPKFDILTYDNPDRRLPLFGGIGGVVSLLLMIPIGWNLVLLWRDAHPPHADQPAPQADGGANGFDPILTPARDVKPDLRGTPPDATPMLASP